MPEPNGEYSASDLERIIVADGEMMADFAQQKQQARAELLAMEPEAAQILANQSLHAPLWSPVIEAEVWLDGWLADDDEL